VDIPAKCQWIILYNARKPREREEIFYLCNWLIVDKSPTLWAWKIGRKHYLMLTQKKKIYIKLSDRHIFVYICINYDVIVYPLLLSLAEIYIEKIRKWQKERKTFLSVFTEISFWYFVSLAESQLNLQCTLYIDIWLLAFFRSLVLCCARRCFSIFQLNYSICWCKNLAVIYFH